VIVHSSQCNRSASGPSDTGAYVTEQTCRYLSVVWSATNCTITGSLVLAPTIGALTLMELVDTGSLMDMSNMSVPHTKR
jgi:hypothetical protein